MADMLGTLAIFAAGALVILIAGSRLAGVADQLADRTGLGEAAAGTILLGAVTSLPGLIASSTAAWNGLPEMAVSNAVGGIAAQTVFLVVADFFHKPANLEHSAASVTNLFSSLPELVTTVACIRQGAYTLAVSGIVGGNAFDTLFVAASDLFYLDGSIYHAMSGRQEFLLALSIMMTVTLVAGMVRRERRGPANIGFEGVLLIAFYALAVATMAFA
ncbi:hypothetical protein [Haloferula sp. A504]|uniref:hypothetical protein n=1 Tax=Haloferula sp. A504 TaxID=3373601 RepID=UPI0031BE6FDE|nr:hypothetical protein [Verrucomicrobiaceae bacterium E54]